MKSIFCFILLIITIKTTAQKFNAGLIPDSLKQNANVVKRYEEIRIEIKSPAKIISHERHVLTILNDAAEKYADYRTYYDQFTTIDYLSGILYDANGKEIQKVKNKEIQDYNYNDNFSLVNDARFKRMVFNSRNYPYTVDFEEDYTKDGLLNIESWLPAQTNAMSVEYSRYIIVAPKNYEVRYKPFNIKVSPIITETADKKIYTWELKNYAAPLYEPLSPSWQSVLPYLMVAPSDFEAQGYKGNMSSWKNYGAFIYELTKGRNMLPINIKKQVHQLTDGLNTTKEKISVLYNYLQQNTHYVSVQLGIGGWQPFDANYVATKKYGDCKALTNYMVALLIEAGIPGKYVEIEAGENAPEIVTDFSESQFNHVICCVPLQKDTVWLECTDQNMPMGYLSGFTQNRWGLMIDENGGQLIHTPKYGLKDNVQSRTIIGSISNDGDFLGKINTNYKALRQDDLQYTIYHYSNDKIEEYIKLGIDLPTYDIVKFNYSQQKDIIPTITETLGLNVKNYAQITGKRLFINPNILNRFNKRLDLNENRKNDIELKNESKEIDSVTLQIPAGYEVESLFKEVNIVSPFGKYTASVKILGDMVMYYRIKENYSGRFPAMDYENLLTYYEKILKADKGMIVFVKAGL